MDMQTYKSRVKALIHSGRITSAQLDEIADALWEVAMYAADATPAVDEAVFNEANWLAPPTTFWKE